MDLSLTLNAELSTLGEFLTILQRWERSASLEERVTMMEELTFMFSSNLKRSEDYQGSTYSMSTATTQMLSLVTQTLERVGSMQLRMATLFVVDSAALQTEVITRARLIRSGLLLWPARMPILFGRMLKAWIRERYASALPAYRPTPATVIGLIEIHTSTQESYWSIVGSILSFKNGWTMSLGSAQKIGECAARGCRTHSLLVVWAELLSRALGSPPPLPPLRSGRQPARGPHPTVAWANILLEGSLSAYSDRQGLAKPCGQGVLANTPTSEDYSAWMSPLKTSTMPYSTICREDSNFSMDTNFGWAVNLNSTQQTNIRESDSYNGEGSQSG